MSKTFQAHNLSLENIRKKAFELGWEDVGITSAVIPPDDIKAYQSWINKGYQASMEYMENTVRCDPQDILPGAKTAIIFISNYKKKTTPFSRNKGIIASYARGKDYHNIHRRRLKKFISWMEEQCGEKNIAKGFSDSTPILEKALAVQAGLGWFGKNTLLIHKKFGTFTFLSGVLTLLDIPTTTPPLSLRTPRCGSCEKCLTACPVGALEKPYTLNSQKCLSFHLIESKQTIPHEIQAKNPGYIFGCDICQDACPHNVRSPLIDEDNPFSSKNGWGEYIDTHKLKTMDEDPESLFGTPLKRKGIKGLHSTLKSLLTSE